MTAIKQTTCIVCDTRVVHALDLGVQPFANALLKAKNQRYESYPLGIAFCPECSHAQLTHFVPPENLFTDYLYASGTSITLKNYFAWFAKKIRYEFGENLHILEIGSNDGSLLDKLTDEKFSVVGVDPAKNLCNIATAKGHCIMHGYFPNIKITEKFHVIIAINVFAHNPSPFAFLMEVGKRLAQNGVCLIQTSQALMLNTGEFDTIYHEHYSFFTFESMRVLAQHAGLLLKKVELTTVHGTSFLFYLCHPKATPIPDTPFPDDTFLAQSQLSKLPFKNSNASPMKVYVEYAKRARDRISEVTKAVHYYREFGYKIALVGVAAKALTFVQAAKLELDGCFDEAELKIGKFVPGCAHPIQSFTEVSKLGNKVLAVIGAWNFADEISRKIHTHNPGIDIKYLTYYPEIREYNL